MINRYCLILCLALAGGMGMGQTAVGQLTSFQPMVDSSLVDTEFGDAAWGDYDNDGDFDLVLTGRSLDQEEGPVPITRIFQYIEDRIFSNMGILTYVTYYNQVIELPGLWQSTVAWGDYDNDNDLDLFIAGLQAGDVPLAQVYENDSGTFALHAGFTGFHSGDVAWGDYDNDGDLDLLAAGIEAGDQYRTVIYENQAGNFTRRDVGLTGVGQASVKWGDYDTDGDLDILLAGMDSQQGTILKVYRNEGGGTFVDIPDTLEGLAFSSADWGDYDTDGDLDILHSGAKYSPFVLEGTARVYRNDGGALTRVDQRLGVFAGNTAWGDFNADARLDYLAFGGVRPHAFMGGQVQENIGSTFRSLAVPFSFTGILFGAADWGDYDGDGDLDFFVTGKRIGGLVPIMVYRNDLDVPQPRPDVPTGLQATRQENGDITLSWQAPPSGEGLSYNLRIGSTPGGSDIVSPMAMPMGRRLLSARGNTGHNLEWTLRLPQGQYYWSVQAINAAFAGSAFAPEEVFSTGDPNDMTPPSVPTGFTATSGDGQVMLSWEPNTEPDFARYLLYRGPTPEAENLLVSLPAGLEMYTDMDVVNGETYYYRLQARDAAGNVSELTEAQLAMPNPRFTEAVIPGLPNFNNASIAWGDYDGDGDPDLVIGSRTQSYIYRNDEGTLVQVQNVMLLWDFPAIDWGDYDADGDLDLVMAGRTGVFGTGGRAVIYRNEEGTFVEIDADVVDIAEGNVLWADYDTDGDLDLLVAGRISNGQGATVLYRNDDGTFVDSGISFSGVASGDAAWGDYDNDGDPDLIISDFTNASDIYRNDSGTFVPVASVTDGFTLEVAWGDYDNDEDLDLFVADLEGSRLYRNDGGTFVDTQNDFPTLLPPNTANANVDMEWGDYDNDGDLDLVFAGSTFTDLYRNTGGGFIREETDLAAFSQVEIDAVDFDLDGDLDLLIAGNRIVFFQNNTIF